VLDAPEAPTGGRAEIEQRDAVNLVIDLSVKRTP